MLEQKISRSTACEIHSVHSTQTDRVPEIVSQALPGTGNVTANKTGRFPSSAFPLSPDAPVSEYPPLGHHSCPTWKLSLPPITHLSTPSTPKHKASEARLSPSSLLFVSGHAMEFICRYSHPEFPQQLTSVRALGLRLEPWRHGLPVAGCK